MPDFTAASKYLSAGATTSLYAATAFLPDLLVVQAISSFLVSRLQRTMRLSSPAVNSAFVVLLNARPLIWEPCSNQG